MIGQIGHGCSAARSLGGSGMISSWCTDAAPCRWAVPRQSAPVSPPPMMTTCRPSAEIGEAPSAPSWTRFDGFRYSRAKCTPSSSRPGTARSRGRVAPPASTTASCSSTSDCAGTTAASGASGPVDLGLADGGGAAELDPLGPELGEPAVEEPLLHLELRDAVAEQAAGLLGPLVDGHRVAGPDELLGGRQAGRARSRRRRRPCRCARGGSGVGPSPRPRPARRSRTRSARSSPGRR